jgi:hypothetical protein
MGDLRNSSDRITAVGTVVARKKGKAREGAILSARRPVVKRPSVNMTDKERRSATDHCVGAEIKESPERTEARLKSAGTWEFLSFSVA